MTMRIDSTESVIDETTRIHHNDELFDGEVETKDASGNVIGLITYWQGIPHGPQTLWYPTGQKRQEGVNNAGVAVGEWQKWHPNGQLAEWRSFSDKGQPLARKRWDKDGNQTEDKTFAQ